MLQEHWLWPFELDLLLSVNADFTHTAVSVSRLHDASALVRGCGGVAILWRKELNASSLQICSDRLCGISTDFSSSSASPRFLSVLGV